MPKPLLFSQNRAREAAVPDDVIERLLEKWEVPDPAEAHEASYFVRGR